MKSEIKNVKLTYKETNYVFMFAGMARKLGSRTIVSSPLTSLTGQLSSLMQQIMRLIQCRTHRCHSLSSLRSAVLGDERQPSGQETFQQSIQASSGAHDRGAGASPPRCLTPQGPTEVVSSSPPSLIPGGRPLRANSSDALLSALSQGVDEGLQSACATVTRARLPETVGRT